MSLYRGLRGTTSTWASSLSEHDASKSQLFHRGNSSLSQVMDRSDSAVSQVIDRRDSALSQVAHRIGSSRVQTMRGSPRTHHRCYNDSGSDSGSADDVDGYGDENRGAGGCGASSFGGGSGGAVVESMYGRAVSGSGSGGGGSGDGGGGGEFPKGVLSRAAGSETPPTPVWAKRSAPTVGRRMC